MRLHIVLTSGGQYEVWCDTLYYGAFDNPVEAEALMEQISANMDNRGVTHTMDYSLEPSGSQF